MAFYWDNLLGVREAVPRMLELFREFNHVDKGIDTGPVVGPTTFAVTARDSFATYAYLHIAAGLPLLVDALRRACEGMLNGGRVASVPSRLRADGSSLRSRGGRSCGCRSGSEREVRDIGRQAGLASVEIVPIHSSGTGFMLIGTV
jgi:hypothetical protein